MQRGERFNVIRKLRYRELRILSGLDLIFKITVIKEMLSNNSEAFMKARYKLFISFIV